MNNRFGTVKNPLTIIAIFSGFAEVSGTAILPFLQSQNQTLYLWFLMIFPLTIIILFYATLNWNYKVLYAPSDFQNEDHFLDILKKASTRDVLNKVDMEVHELVAPTQDSEQTNINVKDFISGDVQVSFSEASIQVKEPENAPSVNDLLEKLGLLKDELSTKEVRETRSKILQGIQRKLMEENRIAENLVIEKLEKELGIVVETEIKINLGTGTYIFDGIIRQNNKLTAVEIKYFRDLSRLSSVGILRNVREQFEKVYNYLSDGQKKDFSLIFVIVTDIIDEKALVRIEFEMQKFPLPVVLKCYEFDKLVDELIRNVA